VPQSPRNARIVPGHSGLGRLRRSLAATTCRATAVSVPLHPVTVERPHRPSPERTLRVPREIAATDGPDVLVFTGGIGEPDPVVRAAAATGPGFLGVAIDVDSNSAAHGDGYRQRDPVRASARLAVTCSILVLSAWQTGTRASCKIMDRGFHGCDQTGRARSWMPGPSRLAAAQATDTRN
jgi:hypothetical protein